MLLIPDLVGSWLSGARVAEATNASTTGLFDLARGEWMTDLVEELGLPRPDPAADPSRPARRSGRCSTASGAATGLAADARVTLVGSHDTASAVVAVPAEDDDAAWISCGTWGLVGIEVDAPIRTEASRLANFTNEGGVDGRVRFLHNVTGLWLLQESIRTWERGGDAGRPGRAAARRGGGSRPAVRGSTPTTRRSSRRATCRRRIAAVAARRAGPTGWTAASRLDGRLVRCILDSLAAAFADSGRGGGRGCPAGASASIHIVGGGSRNELLCQLTADACGLPGHRRAGRGDGDREPAGPGPRPRADRRATSTRCGPWSARPSRSAATSRDAGRIARMTAARCPVAGSRARPSSGRTCGRVPSTSRRSSAGWRRRRPSGTSARSPAGTSRGRCSTTPTARPRPRRACSGRATRSSGSSSCPRVLRDVSDGRPLDDDPRAARRRCRWSSRRPASPG